MSEYYESDFQDPDREIVRPKGIKKSASFSYCKWAAGDWEARFYAWTDSHRRECEFTINQMLNNPAWFKARPPKIDKRAAAANNRARGGKKKRGKRAA